MLDTRLLTFLIFTTLTYHTVPDVAGRGYYLGRQIMQMLCVNIDVTRFDQNLLLRKVQVLFAAQI